MPKMQSAEIKTSHFATDVRTTKYTNTLARPHHVTKIPGLYTKLSIQCTPQPSSTSFATGTTIHFRVDTTGIDKIRGASLRFKITEQVGTYLMKLTDVGHFIDRIEIVPLGGSIMWRTYGDCLYWEMCNLIPVEHQTRGMLKAMNMTEKYYRPHIHGEGKTIHYTLPLVNFPFMNELVSDLSQDLNIKLYLANGITVGGESGTGTVQLDDIHLDLDVVKLTQADKERAAEFTNVVQQKRYLQPVHLQLTSQTLTASTSVNFNLDAFQGDCAFLLFCIRADGYSASGNAHKKFLNLGENATMDLLSPNGSSLYGEGTAVRCQDMLDMAYAKHGLSAKFGEHRAMYIMPFCSNIRAAFQGVKDGYMGFDGSVYKLQLTPSDAGTATVQTVTITSVTVDGGYNRLSFKGENSAVLAATANAATIKSTFEEMGSAQDHPYGPVTVTASAALTSGTPTLTFNKNIAPLNNEDEHVQVVSQNANDGGTTGWPDYQTTVTTYGQSGWTTGSSYTIDIFAYMHATSFKRNGQFRVTTI